MSDSIIGAAATPSRSLRLLDADGCVVSYAVSEARPPFARSTRPHTRIAYSAAHVVADPRAPESPWLTAAIDWDATVRYRQYLWGLGLGVAEAMDTAQRGMGLDWPTSLALIRRSIDASRDYPGALIASGAGTDHLQLDAVTTLDEVIRAYCEQVNAIQSLGGRIILMASRALARVARVPSDYVKVYSRVLAETDAPVIIHWLGDMFDPQLAGYWGSTDLDRATETALEVIHANTTRIDGIKISLLSAEREIAMRRRLPPGVRMYSGDDFNYPALIRGDEEGFSHALLGIFDAIAPVAAAALDALAAGDLATYDALLAPTVPLSRHIFEAPTRFYKTGIVFMAYLNGMQDHFTMVGGQQSARSIRHLSTLFRLADEAGLLSDPERAVVRMRRVLQLYGLD